MGKRVGVNLSGNEGELIDIMTQIESGDPRPIIDEMVKDVERKRDEWLGGSDFIDRGVVISGKKIMDLEIVEGIGVEMVVDWRDGKLYARVATKVDKA